MAMTMIVFLRTYHKGKGKAGTKVQYWDHQNLLLEVWWSLSLGCTLSNLKSGTGRPTKNNKREESLSEFREERAKSNK